MHMHGIARRHAPFQLPFSLTISLTISLPFSLPFPLPFSLPIQLPVSFPISLPISSPIQLPISFPIQLPISTPRPNPITMFIQSDFQDLPWITKFAGKRKDERSAKDRIRRFLPLYLQPNKYPHDKYNARISELSFENACRVGAHSALTHRSVIALKDNEWETAKELLSAGNTLPPTDYFSIARDVLPSDLHSLFEAQWTKVFGPIKKEKVDAKTESAKLDAALEQAAIATTPADVELKIFREPVAGHFNEHGKAIANSEATYNGEVGYTARKEVGLLRQFAILSQKFNELVEHNAQVTEQLKRSGASFEEFGREFQSRVDSLIPAQASTPKFTGSSDITHTTPRY